MLEIKNISKSFDKTCVLDDISFTVNEGSILGLVGVNGAGKSTLLRCIAGVYDTDEGSVVLNNQNTLLDHEIRKSILFVSDDPYLPANETILHIMAFYESFYDLDVDKTLRLFNELGLDLEAQFSTFSKGMKRQVALGCAINANPKLLMLDEMFDGLDPLIRLKFKKAIIDLITEKNTTVIISSHNLKELEDICDSFVLLEDGKLSTSGDLQETKALINKYQVAFNEAKDESVFDDFNVMHFERQGRVITLVIKGEMEEVLEKLNELNPVLVDTLPVNFEELFIYEMESRGHLHE